MKKISLKGISEILSENDLKNIRGGSGGSNPCNRPGYPCKNTACYTPSVPNGICSVKKNVCGCYSV